MEHIPTQIVLYIIVQKLYFSLYFIFYYTKTVLFISLYLNILFYDQIFAKLIYYTYAFEIA